MTSGNRQLPDIEVIPKVGTFHISTGNILRWSRIRTYKTSNEEVWQLIIPQAIVCLSDIYILSSD